ncbi:MAG: hypothetical protein WC951_11055 [Bacteroidales bacterium]
MKNRILLILVVFGFASCSPAYYMPNNVNVPLFKEKGETQVQAHIGTAEKFNSAGINVAHAIGRSTALMFFQHKLRHYNIHWQHNREQSELRFKKQSRYG